ncbi:gamma-glutamylcyclotransferase family protein [Streptomyces sp. NPDC017943]|uniref:gamma-glutamylcyclotransferase family protein n=1 Tax=Streptomyces sp. NPDC017943 TaxID=3365019 RepID=UPI003787F476
MTLPFFVYGTLRPGEVNHRLFLHGRTRSEEPARLADTVLYEGPGYPYAVEEPGGGEVRGELVTALPRAYGALLAELDRLEEYAPGDPRSLYVRVERDVVRDADGAGVRAWVYIAGPDAAKRLRDAGRRVAGTEWRGRR